MLAIARDHVDITMVSSIEVFEELIPLPFEEGGPKFLRNSYLSFWEELIPKFLGGTHTSGISAVKPETTPTSRVFKELIPI